MLNVTVQNLLNLQCKNKVDRTDDRADDYADRNLTFIQGRFSSCMNIIYRLY